MAGTQICHRPDSTVVVRSLRKGEVRSSILRRGSHLSYQLGFVSATFLATGSLLSVNSPPARVAYLHYTASQILYLANVAC